PGSLVEEGLERRQGFLAFEQHGDIQPLRNSVDQRLRAVSSRYSQSMTVVPRPWSCRRTRSSRARSSAATRSGSPAIAPYAATVGPYRDVKYARNPAG